MGVVVEAQGQTPQTRLATFLAQCGLVLATAVAYYVATRIAWALCFPDSKVSLFFPPHAVLASILLMVPTRRWWAYVCAAAAAHFLATQLEHWPTSYALQCEAFDALQNVAAAAGIRFFIKSPLGPLTLRDALVFVLVAVVLVPFGTAFWGASFTVSNGYGTDYWIEWRNLGISNAVTAIVLVPALLAMRRVFVTRPAPPSPARVLEAVALGMVMLAFGHIVFDRTAAGPGTSPALLYTGVPLLIWAALRFGTGGTSAATLIIAFQAISGTMRGHGPFLMQRPAENALALQSFLIVTATPLMLLTVLIEDDRRSKEEAITATLALNQKRAELEHIARVATLGELTATVTHQFKQPLHAIRLHASLGKHLLEGPASLQKARETFSAIDELTRGAGQMLDGMSGLIKRETPGFTNVDLNQLIRDVARIAKGDAILHNVTVELDLLPGAPQVEADGVQLTQVMLNLLLNAFHAMREPGLATHARRVVVRTKAADDGSRVLVVVQDTGTGITPEKLGPIFEPFITSKPDGLGLGLSICRTIIERHGGEIRAANNPDGGATFSITLPVQR